MNRLLPPAVLPLDAQADALAMPKPLSRRAAGLSLMAGVAGLAGLGGPGLAGAADEAASAPVAKRPMFKRGDTPPDQVGLTMGHDPVLLSQHAGKVVVVSFWATWCGYCLKELPILASIQRTLGEQNVQVIAVNVEDRDTFRRVRSKLDGLGLVHAYDPVGRNQKAHDVTGFPHTLIVGRDGKVHGVHRGYDESGLQYIVDDLNRAAASKPAEQPAR